MLENALYVKFWIKIRNVIRIRPNFIVNCMWYLEKLVESEFLVYITIYVHKKAVCNFVCVCMCV